MIMLDLLEDYLVCELLFECFLEFLLFLKVCYYLILSLLKVNSGEFSIIVGVVMVLVWSGWGEYCGVVLNYLVGL